MYVCLGSVLFLHHHVPSAYLLSSFTPSAYHYCVSFTSLPYYHTFFACYIFYRPFNCVDKEADGTIFKLTPMHFHKFYRKTCNLDGKKREQLTYVALTSCFSPNGAYSKGFKPITHQVFFLVLHYH